ncbi:hypothetical protein EVAR_27295_1 [Eumeta japonica]|uniref:Uncharacterized protein n=1 Tax=Eumeta variegata TaxID=151549 RepID=A0A4C1UDM4_EUMVA|nr:hypothetical protein EVAR_27295_1 [Eumeta japonica]
MSLPHTLAPVRVGSVGLKPTKKVPLKIFAAGWRKAVLKMKKDKEGNLRLEILKRKPAIKMSIKSGRSAAHFSNDRILSWIHRYINRQDVSVESCASGSASHLAGVLNSVSYSPYCCSLR